MNARCTCLLGLSLLAAVSLGCQNNEPDPFAGKSPKPAEEAKSASVAELEEPGPNLPPEPPPEPKRLDPQRDGKKLSYWTDRLTSGDSSRDDRLAAIEAIERFGANGRAAAPALIDVLLGDRADDGEQDRCADALRQLDAAKDAADKLYKKYAGLGDGFEDFTARERTAGLMARLGAAGLPQLLKAARSGGLGANPASTLLMTFSLPKNDPAVEATAKLLAEEILADPSDMLLPAMLGRLGARAIPQIRTLIESENSLVRAHALLALIPMRDASPALPWVYPALRDESADVRKHAAAVLGEIGGDAKIAVPDLAKAASDDPDQEVRLSAAIALAQVDPRHAAGLPTLKHFAEQGDERQRRFAVRALGELDAALGAEVVPLLAAALRSGDEMVRSEAMTGLAEKHGESAAAVFAEALADENADVAIAAATGLSLLEEKARPAAAALVTALEHSSERVRLKAAAALLRCGESQQAALALLMTMLDSADLEQRLNAISALRDAGEEASAAVPKLTRMLDDERVIGSGFNLSHLGGYARTALQAIDPELKQSREVLKQRIVGADTEVAVKCLVFLDEALAAELLTELRDHEDEAVRRAARAALERLSKNEASK